MHHISVKFSGEKNLQGFDIPLNMLLKKSFDMKIIRLKSIILQNLPIIFSGNSPIMLKLFLSPPVMLEIIPKNMCQVCIFAGLVNM